MAQAPTMSLKSLEPFDCEGDPTSVGIRWGRWIRGLEIYLTASNIISPANKRATLLHVGGLQLQEVYYNIPEAHVEERDGIDVYQIALNKLTEYFAPKQSRYYERYLFRLIKQEEQEQFEKFLLRLRYQADKCEFSTKEEHIIDQIIEKCRPTELRKKILSAGDGVTLDQIINEANSLEAITRQLQKIENKNTNYQQDINATEIKKPNTKNNRYKERKEGTSSCSRCGSNKHSSDDNKCPAKDKRCLKCGFIGHFMECCRTTRKRRGADFRNQHKKKPRTEPPKTKQEIDYIFNLDDDSVIKCNVGGVMIDMLIDSGSKCNVISDKTWENLKDHQAMVYNQNKNPDKILLPYGSSKPLDVIGSFEADIDTNNNSKKSVIYVIRNGTRNLLGKCTAIELGVLKIGLQINAVDTFPKFKDVKVHIPINKNIKPIIQPYRRIPIPLEEKVDTALEELKAADIIEKVTGPSPWVSPMVPVIKENGEVRICIDMRRANEAIDRENHPLPTMDELLPTFRKAKYFSRLDIKNAFHQLEIDEGSRYITTFSTNKGLYRYKRLMFGISCAPEIFQKTLEEILLGCEGTANFIDDIIIHGADEQEHDERLHKVLKVLKDNNILLNDKKCVYKTKQINFLGHELSKDGVKPLGKYADSVQSSRRPENVAELLSFLGLVNFVGKWIPNLASLTEPLRELLRLKLCTTANFGKHWTSVQERAFLDLKDCLSNIQTLGYYNPADKTQVLADASPVGLGAVLVQIGRDGPRIIAYGNKSLTDCEKRYCQTEKEALALVWAVEHFKMYLLGKEFDLISDHKPLEIIFGPKSKPCARIERWVLRLQAYKYNIIYRPGKSNIADPLSRLCRSSTLEPFDNENYINDIIEYSRPTAVSLKEIERESVADKEIGNLKRGVYENVWDNAVTNYKPFQTELCFQGDIALRGSKIVIPMKLRQKVLEAAHQGHPGIVAMKARLRTKVWWHGIDKEAEKKVKSCRECTLVSAPNPPQPMKRRDLPVEAWVDVAIDFMGPLPTNEYLLLVVDYYSRYKEIKVMRNTSAVQTVQVLKEIFSRLGYPATLTCDNGNQFTSEAFKSFCKECGIILNNTIPYWPQMNGEVERQNRDVLKRLKISHIRGENWKDNLLDYLTMYNSTPHTVTGKTPSELFFKRMFRDKIPNASDIEYRTEDSEVRDRDAEKKMKGKEYSDRKRKASESHLEVGEKVYVKNMTKENKLTPNFNPTTHTVTRVNGGDTCVRNDATGKDYRRNVIHLKKVNEDEWAIVNQDKDCEMDLIT